MAPPSAHALAVSSRLEGVVVLDLTVTATSWVLPGLRSLVATGDLTGFAPVAGQDLMVPVAVPSGRSRWRRYTLRRVDLDRSTVELWITTDSGGPGARWASEVGVGDTFEVVGPRGKVRVDETASTHLFVVDTSGLAAMLAMAESIDPPGDRARRHGPGPPARSRPAVERAAGVDGTDSWRVTHRRRQRRAVGARLDRARRDRRRAGRRRPRPPTSSLSSRSPCTSPRRSPRAAWRRSGSPPSPTGARAMANQDHGEPDKTVA